MAISPKASTDSSHRPVADRRARIAWCLFDFANSAFPTVALTAFGGPYFTETLVGPGGLSFGPFFMGPTTAWGAAIALAMALVSLSSPVMGALADRGGYRRRFLALYVFVCVASTAALACVPPGHGLWAFGLYVVAVFSFEGAYVFYNAFLPVLAPPDRVGRLSGQAWALGYVGGLLALLSARAFIPERYTSETGASGVYLVVAGWYLVFSLPALLWLPRAHGYGAKPRVLDAFKAVATTFRRIRRFPDVFIFVAAFFLFNDAIVTVIEFTGVYTKEVLAFSPAENIVLFLVLNLVAAPGALVFGRLLDWTGGKRAIALSLVLWTVASAGAALAQTRTQFWFVAGLAAIVIGATQAASRAFMARLSPANRTGEFMGFLAFSGKASAVLGPMLYGLVADGLGGGAGGHRAAIATIGLFFPLSLWVLARVDETRGIARARQT